MEVDRERDPLVGLRERGVGVAILEFANRDFVGLGFRMQQRRRRLARQQRIDHGLARRIFDVDQFGRILGEVAVLRDDQRHRLADIPHTIDGKRPLMYRRLQRHQERIGQLAHVLAGDHRPDAVMRQRGSRVDTDDVGVRVRRADHMRVKRAGLYRQVVGIAPASGQQTRVFLAQRRRAESLWHGSTRPADGGNGQHNDS